MFEGGIRGNAFASGGLIPQSARGTKLEGMIHIVDWCASPPCLAPSHFSLRCLVRGREYLRGGV